MNSTPHFVLGSQSPQRRKLLEQLVPHECIIRWPPQNSEELGFFDLTQRTEISKRLAQIARTKNEDVTEQCFDRGTRHLEDPIILTADTIIVVSDDEKSLVLGKPDGENWEQTVRDWFMKYYSDASHEVVSGVCLRMPDGDLYEFECSTTVKFKKVSPELLEWYISTKEPLGKAGGYGIQSAGSIFVESIHGSLSNVIGLPLEMLVEYVTPTLK